MQQDNQSVASLQLCTKLSGNNKFKPSGEQTLPSLELLLERAVPELGDVTDAAKQWRDEPPDAEFKTVLDAS